MAYGLWSAILATAWLLVLLEANLTLLFCERTRTSSISINYIFLDSRMEQFPHKGRREAPTKSNNIDYNVQI